MPGSPDITTLIVDDEIDMRILVRTVLQLAKADMSVVAEASDGEHALEVYRQLDPPPTPTVVILDNRMPRRTGLEAAEEILTINPDQIVILYSAQLDEATVAAARELGVAACLTKEELDRIPAVIEALVSARRGD